MCKIKVNIRCKQFKKADKSTKKIICKSLIKLYRKIEANGNDVSKIYNNEDITHDRINKELYIYKTHGIDNTQLRLVYSYDNPQDTIYLVDYVNKKQNNKNYITEMNQIFKNTGISDLDFEEIVSW